MNSTRRTIAALAVAISAVVGLAPGAQHVAAAPAAPAITTSTDPTLAVVCDAKVLVGRTLHCTVTVSQLGYTPGGQRITYRRCTTCTTINVANSSVIPMTAVRPRVWAFRYVVTADEKGRFEVFSVSTACTRLGCRVRGSAGFTVV